jgi:nuclear GTP-binding protein
MAKLLKLQRFRRARAKLSLDVCNPIDAGLVRCFNFSLRFYLSCIGNTRVISQTALDHFRTGLQEKQHDPYSVLLRRNKLPMQLLSDAANPNLRKVRTVFVLDSITSIPH